MTKMQIQMKMNTQMLREQFSENKNKNKMN